MSLPEILQWIQFSRKSGTVVFERPGIVKKVFIEEGMIVSASSNDPREYLGQILVFFGSLTEDQLTEAFQVQKKKKKLLGKVLSEDFNVPTDKIIEALRLKIEETIYDLFLWSDGKFIYSEGLKDLAEHDRMDAAISVEAVIFEGARRVDEWKEFRKIFPHDGVVFQKKKSNDSVKKLLKDAVTKKIYDQIDGAKSIQRIMLDTHAPDYRAYEAFGKLYWAKAIDADKKLTKEPEDKGKDFQSDLLQSAELYKSKKYDEAYELVENFLINTPENEEARALFRLVRDAYIKSLYSVCPETSVPRLARDFEELNEQIYSSKEGYLASRINGEWDVKSLIMISPLGELDSLRILKRLHDADMVKFN